MSTAKETKKSAFSCQQCRSRKVKCGAESPSCKRCIVRGEACIYKLNPTLTYTERLEKKIRELEDEVTRLRSATGEAYHQHAKCHLSTPTTSRPGADKAASDPGISAGFAGLKLDPKGIITYHGSTSFFQESSHYIGDFPPSTGRDGSVNMPTDSAARDRLVSNAWEQRALESLSTIPEPFQYLIDLHWCWIQPLFNFIYRPAFSRDIDVLGPYYSHTLLNALISHSIRWGRNNASVRAKLEPYDQGEVFGRQARSLVFDELNRGVCTIPTVQTLLLLSASECSAGHSAQAWVYSGIAFRLVDHMGIYVDSQRYAGNVLLTEEDIEIRHRLFWSCYFWDKMISLYLGRSPQIHNSEVSPPQVMLDDSAETELWIPHGVSFPDGQHYPPTQAHSTSCFMQVCQLSVIFNQILINIYDPLREGTEYEIQTCIKIQERALSLWWENLPQFLKLDASDLPMFAPPSHIVTLNCLYHTFRILLFRPTLTRGSDGVRSVAPQDPRYLLDCVSSAVSIIAIFDLFCRSFGYTNCILSLSYSVYIASSIFLLQVEAGLDDEQTLCRLGFCIDSLENVKTINPVIKNALGPIYEKLNKLDIFMPSLRRNHTGRDDNASYSTISGSSQVNTSQVESIAVNNSTHPDSLGQSISAPLSLTGMENIEIPENFFEAVCGLEPLSVRIRPPE
ncbi:fungal-specific transcription factor domain-containing protein [Xylariales sp. PMI_506]|nr:fungal-specific transcription factor domain-containing protein [Xylariales sp. PMI_506]